MFVYVIVHMNVYLFEHNKKKGAHMYTRVKLLQIIKKKKKLFFETNSECKDKNNFAKIKRLQIRKTREKKKKYDILDILFIIQ